MKKPRYNQQVDLTIRNLGHNGEGIGSWQGYTLFADFALPGEVVRGKIFETKRHYGRLQVEQIDQPSLDRVKPICPLFTQCGGCQLMHLRYEKQLEYKRQLVIQSFEKIGFKDLNVAPCLPSPKSLHYRNKIQMPAVADKIGLYIRNSHDLIDVEHCYVHSELGQNVYENVREILKKHQVKGSDEGLLRCLLIKTAVNTHQALITLVTSSLLPNGNLIAEEMMQKIPEVKGVLENINSANSNVILGDCYRLLAGRPYIFESLNGMQFKVSAGSFFQVNPYQAEQLYKIACEFCEPTPSAHLLDAYCGVGTMSLMLAKSVKHVTGIENVPEAIADADENARLNQIENATFVCANAEEHIESLENIDIVLLNPPRKGCAASLLKRVGELKPNRIVYVSCDPGTLARDLRMLTGEGFLIEKIQPIDMFPQTAHVETVAKLKHRESGDVL